MTILMAIALSDAVVLMADGRRANKVEVITDAAEKIVPLRDDLMLAVSGAEIGTDLATAELRRGAAASAAELVQQFNGLVLGCATHVMSLITPETRSQTHIKVGLLAAGFDTAGPFLAGALYGDGMQAAGSVLARPEANTPRYVVLGGEEVGAEGDFRQRLTRVVGQVLQPSAGGSNRWSPLLAAGAETIRLAAQRNSSIGGRIQYRVLQRGRSAQAGFL